jgi:hypothetical protein
MGESKPFVDLVEQWLAIAVAPEVFADQASCVIDSPSCLGADVRR